MFTDLSATIKTEKATNLLWNLKDRPASQNIVTVGAPTTGRGTASVLADPVYGGTLVAAIETQGTAEAGALHLFAQSHALARHSGVLSTYDLMASASGFASASSSDTVTWSVASLPAGTPLTLEFSVTVDADLSYQTLIASTGNETRSTGFAQSGGSVNFSGVGVSGAFSLPKSTVSRTWGGVDNSDLRGLGTFTFEQVVLNGTPVTLSMAASAHVSLDVRDYCGSYPSCKGSAGGIEATAVSDMQHTFAWGGVQGVHLADGTALDLASLVAVSDSGIDYLQAQAVPEPASAGLIAAGLVVVTLRCRRRRGQKVCV